MRKVTSVPLFFGFFRYFLIPSSHRNNVDISKGQDNEANSQVHPAVVVQKAKDCLRGLMGSKNASLQLQVLKVLCEVPLVHAVTFVQQVIQLCNREFSVPMVKAKAIFFFARTGLVFLFLFVFVCISSTKLFFQDVPVNQQ